MIKLVIADDHKMFSSGIRSMLDDEKDLEIVKSVHDGKELLEYLKTNTVDIILMDINMPKTNGIEASKFIIQNYKFTKIIILSMYKNPLIIRELIKINVHAYILKDTDRKELIIAIRTVLRNKKYYDPRVKEVFIEHFSKGEYTENVKLTPREKEIIKLIYEGKTSQSIADALFISQYTVDTHRKNLMLKTGCRNAIELAKYYRDNELLI